MLNISYGKCWIQIELNIELEDKLVDDTIIQ